MNLKRKFFSNLIYAFSAQFISLIFSLIMSIIVPKILNVTEYAYWQLFIFYSNYVNIAQFGVVDGIYLKNGGIEYENLNFNELGFKYRVYAFFQVMVAIFIVLVSFFLVRKTEINKFFVFASVAIYMVVYNLSRYLGFVFQTSNNTKWFSITSIIDRSTIIILGLIAIVTKNFYWQTAIILFILGMIISLFYSFFKGRKIVFANCDGRENKKAILKDMYNDSKVGINLTISNLASLLILGCGRQFVETNWGIETFGKVSFALSITNFFLLFLNQASLVMFPALKQIKSQVEVLVFRKLNTVFSVLSPIVYVGYIPISYLLSLWLPQYEQSLKILMLFMPICVFDGKMQLIYTTYFKALREEKKLLFINLFSVTLSFILCCVATFVFKNLYMLLCFLVFVIVVRSFISLLILTRNMQLKKVIREFVFDLAFAVLFIALNILSKNVVAFIVILIVYLLYIVFRRYVLLDILKGCEGLSRKIV